MKFRRFFDYERLVFLILLAGFILRFLTARGTWLNPDETLQYLIANQQNLVEVYQASLTNAHPPLLFFILYFWRMLGTSEIFLRLISVLSGSAGIWFFYQWLSLRFDRITGMVGAILFAFLPPLVALSAELRQYALMIFFITIALFLLEKGIKDQRPSRWLFAGIFSALAGLTQYSAIWFSITIGGYLLAIGMQKIRRKMLFYGLIGQVVAGFVYLMLYFTHLRTLRKSPITVEAITGWLSPYYYQGDESPFFFLIRNTLDFFKYLAGSKVMGIITLGLFVSGLTLILFNRKQQVFAIIIVLPLLLISAGALFRLLPYGGTRHSIVLAPFVCAGIAVIAHRLKQKLSVVAFVLAGVFVLLSNLLLVPPGQYIARRDAVQDKMSRAIVYLKDKALPNDTIFTDYQGAVLLSYYLNRPDNPAQFFGRTSDGFWEFDYGGYTVVAPQEWNFNHKNFPLFVDRLIQEYHFPPNRVVWVFDGGWGMPLVVREELFGNNLSVFAITGDMFINQQNVESLLALALEKMRAVNYPSVNSVILPTRFTSPRIRTKAKQLAENVLTYSELYEKAQMGKQVFDTQLPALTFYLFSYYEWHPEFMRYMADGENYISGGYCFTLLLMDANRQIAVYLLEQIR